jgi:hypothetical protein
MIDNHQHGQLEDVELCVRLQPTLLSCDFVDLKEAQDATLNGSYVIERALLTRDTMPTTPSDEATTRFEA